MNHEAGPPTDAALFSKLQFLQKIHVFFRLFLAKVRQQTATLSHHQQKAPPRPMVFAGILKVTGKAVDPFRKESDLHGRVPGVPGPGAELPNNFVGPFFG
jgi:hypothetical protein